MESDESTPYQGIYADTGTNGQQPTIDVMGPDAGGAKSRNAAGGNKRDPMSSPEVVGHTIAGRTNVADGSNDIEGDDTGARIGGAPQHVTES